MLIPELLIVHTFLIMLGALDDKDNHLTLSPNLRVTRPQLGRKQTYVYQSLLIILPAYLSPIAPEYRTSFSFSLLLTFPFLSAFLSTTVPLIGVTTRTELGEWEDSGAHT